jgi:hypothetical protein
MPRQFNYPRRILMVTRRSERRHPDRLKDGDRRTCPDCGSDLEFRESYLVFRPERQAIEPAWICLEQGCGYRQFVRRLSA